MDNEQTNKQTHTHTHTHRMKSTLCMLYAAIAKIQ